ncbi:MAG: ATPase, T2SS/T4P/T4SS family [bacterium]|nr:Flp pilus assembly complex ATPase component TadA [bacterium]
MTEANEAKNPKKTISVSGNIIEPFAKELVREGLVTQDQLLLAQASVENLGVDLAHILISRGFLKEEDLLNFLSKKLSIPLHKPKTEEVDIEILRMLPFHLAKKHFAIPLYKQEDGKTFVVMADPNDASAKEDLRGYFPDGVSVRLGSPQDILELLEKHHSRGSTVEASSVVMEMGDSDDVEADLETQKIREMASGPKIIATVNNIIARAKKEGASDIHIEPFRESCRIRYRVDGTLRERGNLPKSMHMGVVSRIKIMCQLNIAERRVPQDGRARVRLVGKPLDMRISTCPTSFGEKVVFRLFSKDSIKSIEGLGFLERDRKLFTEIISKPHGIFLVTGPTGSGKSTTMYAGLMRVNSPDVNIMTIEDPVENELEGVNQIPVNEKTGLTFARVLRAALRQDPDIIMIGEIRDAETANIGIRAAITGHMVLSTLHTNSAAGAVDRLKDIGVEPFMIASSLKGVLAQRLVKRMCGNCKQEISTENPYNIPLKKNYISKGCDDCNFTGYAGGRVGLFELIPINSDIRKLIHNNAESNEIMKYMRNNNLPNLLDDGIIKVEMGLLSLDDVMHVISED